MPRWWKIGFVSVLLITTGALSAHFALKDPAFTGEHEAAVAEYADSNYLYWEWSDEVGCEIYERCQFIEVEGTDRCPEQILIQMHLEDINDEWVDSASTVMHSPGQKGSARIELGVDRTDFEYFVVGNIRCTAAIPNVEAGL